MDLIWNSKISVDSQQRNTKTKKKINNSEKMTNIAKKEKKREVLRLQTTLYGIVDSRSMVQSLRADLDNRS